LGLELGLVCVEHFLILFAGFIRQDDPFGVEAVSDGVLGGSFSAGFGFGPVGFCAVGTGGVDFSLGGQWVPISVWLVRAWADSSGLGIGWEMGEIEVGVGGDCRISSLALGLG
jgi:hypothetical protein